MQDIVIWVSYLLFCISLHEIRSMFDWVEFPTFLLTCGAGGECLTTELIISNLLQDNNTQAGDITGGHRTDLVVVTLTVEFSHSHWPAR